MEKRNPQCAINSDDNDLLTKQSSGLHIPPHCFLRIPLVKSWANTSLWDARTNTRRPKEVLLYVYVCPCVSKPLRTIAQDSTVTPGAVLTFTTCLSAVNLFAQSFQGPEPLPGVCLDHSSDFLPLLSVSLLCVWDYMRATIDYSFYLTWKTFGELWCSFYVVLKTVTHYQNHLNQNSLKLEAWISNQICFLCSVYFSFLIT